MIRASTLNTINPARIKQSSISNDESVEAERLLDSETFFFSRKTRKKVVTTVSSVESIRSSSEGLPSINSALSRKNIIAISVMKMTAWTKIKEYRGENAPACDLGVTSVASFKVYDP